MDTDANNVIFLDVGRKAAIVSFLGATVSMKPEDDRISLSFFYFGWQFDKKFPDGTLKVNFQKGDVVFENISLLSNENKFSIQGRNINYQKDNLLFYELAFETKDLKKICEKVCNDQDIVDKIIHNKINIKSKGILNLNKAKISVQENFFKKFFNENEIKKLNTNLNTLIIFGKLENIFELSRYFVLL